MQVYLVGGAVRDRLLGRPCHEKDYVVVGATPEQMTAQGFRPVGRDFPVFLHPHTHEEYALARTERKTAPGYRGFVCHADPAVTLEQDLARRDLTINAIAATPDGQLLDPYAGQYDLHNRWLRHISPSFSEDPVRLLRLARLSAQLAPWGFRIAPETHQLLVTMVERGEVDALVPERVWAECHKALCSPAPQRFFSLLASTGALQRLLPELLTCPTLPNDPTRSICLQALILATQISPEPEIRLAALLHGLPTSHTEAAHPPNTMASNTAVLHSPPTYVREGPHAVGLFGTRSSHPWALDVRHPWLPTVPKQASPSGPPNAVLTQRVGCKNQPLRVVLGGEWIKAPNTMATNALTLDTLAARIKLPNRFRDLATKIQRYHAALAHAPTASAEDVYQLLSDLGLLRQPQQLEAVLATAQACWWVTHPPHHDFPATPTLRQALVAAQSVTVADLPPPLPKGPALGAALRAARVAAIHRALPV